MSPSSPIFGERERGSLLPSELFWRDNYDFLKSKGYELRPRYKPDWIPSWRGGHYSPADIEDAQVLMPTNICDATRISDGAFVILKKISPSKLSDEEELAFKFGSGDLLDDPRNHSIPVYESLDPPHYGSGKSPARLLVMPLARPYDDPIWFTLGEAVECFRQIFEGVHFLHIHHTAHRDCQRRNIMMEPSICLDDCHPARREWRRDWMGPARLVTRMQRPPRYWIIDFGLSRTYDPAKGPALDLPVGGGDRTLPELNNYDERCDPFPADVYTLGNWVQDNFIRYYRGFDFMVPLISDMMQEDLNKRPKMADVVVWLDKIINSLGSWKLYSRLGLRRESARTAFWRDVSHCRQRAVFALKRMPALPSPRPQAAQKPVSRSSTGRAIAA